jgi:hypothetical protein
MAFPKILKNFRLKPIFPLLSPAPQDEATSSTPLEPLLFVSCVVVSSDDDKGKTIVVDSTWKSSKWEKEEIV